MRAGSATVGSPAESARPVCAANATSGAHVFAAVRPATGDDVALAHVSTVAMNVVLARFAETLAADEHAVMARDDAGRRAANDLRMPANVALAKLPPYAPELNPVERVRLSLRERCLSRSMFNDCDALDGAW